VDILEGLLHMALGRVRKRLHPDGWLEISLEDQASRYVKRLEQKLSQNKHSFEATVESPERWDAFKRTVQMLQARGRVCLARLPVAPQVFALEQAAAPDFDDKISAVAHAMGVPFINLMDMSDRVSTTDGSHISKASAPEVATELL